MKNRLVAALGIVLFVALGSVTASAQDHSRGWDTGNIVQVTNVHIKDGMFNAYINDLNNVWRKFLEEQMKDGSVIDYGMYSNPNSRKGEPDLILTVTYANWAAFDRGVEYFEEIGSKVLGSTENMRTANIDRGKLREIGSTTVLQEIKFKD
jgi:3-hydroxy-3-methylglutaryl CoA synthase